MKDIIKQVASDAICVANACNLSGVVRSFAKVFDQLPNDKGTDWRNNHPVCILYAQAICNIQGVNYDATMKYYWAYGWCDEAAKGNKDSWEYVQE
jgi:hypothetical protein